jgi:chromosome partitioning protein
MIINVGGIKGGTGKTTVATNLAVWLSKRKKDVLLVDADDQETATDFTAWRQQTLKEDAGYTAVKITGENLLVQTLKLKTKYDYIIIDTGGRDTTSQRSAIVACDLFLLPLQPRGLDMWTLTKVKKMLSEMRAVKPSPLRAIAFLNRADPRGAENNDAKDLLSKLDYIEYLDKPLGNRKSFATAAANGLSVIEQQPQDSKAVAELTSLFTAIMGA